MPTKTQFIGIIALLYLLLSCAALGLVLYEVYSGGKELENRVALIAERNAKVRMYTELSRLIDDTEEQRAELSTYVLTEDKTSSFLTEVEALGRTLGVVLSTKSLSVEEKDGMFDDLHIEFVVEGTERSVKNMLSIFETLPYHSTVSAVSFAKEGAGNLSGTIKLSVSLRAYDE